MHVRLFKFINNFVVVVVLEVTPQIFMYLKFAMLRAVFVVVVFWVRLPSSCDSGSSTSSGRFSFGYASRFSSRSRNGSM